MTSFTRRIRNITFSLDQLRQEICEAKERADASKAQYDTARKAAGNVPQAALVEPRSMIQELADSIENKLGISKAESVLQPFAADIQGIEQSFKIEAVQSAPVTIPIPGPITSSQSTASLNSQLRNSASFEALGQYVVKNFGPKPPKRAELRSFLFADLTQRYEVLRRQDVLDVLISGYDKPYLVAVAANRLAQGCEIEDIRDQWLKKAGCCIQDTKDVDWLLALQAGVLDHNIKRMVEELALRGKISAADAELAKETYFFKDPVSDQEEFRSTLGYSNPRSLPGSRFRARSGHRRTKRVRCIHPTSRDAGCLGDFGC